MCAAFWSHLNTPELKHSLVAEMWLRTVYANDTVALLEDATPIDYKVITLIRYREILLSQGKEAADNWPVLNLDPWIKASYEASIASW